MKITILGTGCIWTRRACASYLVNDNILIDCGNGTLKQLLKTSNQLLHHEKIEKIKLFLITHYHLDHYFDIVNFMWKIASEKKPHLSATIICPPGGEKKIKDLCRLGMSENSFNKLNFDKYITFVDASKMGTFHFGDLEISALKMDHGDIDDYGYFLKEKNGKITGFTGDSNMCENMQKMIDTCNLAFVDMAGTDISNKHFNIIDGIELIKKYEGKCNIVPCHLTSQAFDYCVGKIALPEDLMVVDTKSATPYNWHLEGLAKEQKTISFDFEKQKFARICGNLVDLVLDSTKQKYSEYAAPTYFFDVVVRGTTTIVGRVTYSVLEPNQKGHFSNVFMTFERDYDLKSIEYECCLLIKQLAVFHKAKWLYLSCDPGDFATRLVFEKLGTSLQEIKTGTYFDEEKSRQIKEQCVFLWEFEDGK